MKRILILAVAGMGINGWAGESSGAAFLRINPSVRGEALGGMNPAGSQGAAGMGVNPANLGAMEGKYELTSGFAAMMGESQYGTVGVGMKRKDGVAIGFQGTYLQSGSLQGRDGNGNISAAFQARDMAGGITGAVGNGRFRAGLTAKAVRQEIGELKSDTAAAWDVGLGGKAGSMEWGASALNLGGGIRFSGRKDPLPTTYNGGLALPLGGGLTGLAGVSVGGGETTASGGVEYRLGSIDLRLGCRSGGGENPARKSQKSGEQALGGITGGIGIMVKGVRIDYAVSQTAVEYGMGHRAAVTFRWGESGGKKAEVRAPAKKASSIGVKTGSRRAYDPAPIKKTPRGKSWVR